MIQVSSQSVSCVYTHLLKLCLEECNRIKSHRLFNGMPQRVAQALATGRIIHAQSVMNGIALTGQLGNAIVDLYAKCGDVNLAEKAFNWLERRDVLAWNSILYMHLRLELLEKVIQSFGFMQNSGVLPNQFTFAFASSACGRLMTVESGRQVHAGVIKMGFKSDSFCQGSLIDMYARCTLLADARHIFDEAVNPDTVSWTAMISGYVRSGFPKEALKIFDKMVEVGHEPDQVALVTAITACNDLGRLDDARFWFSHMFRPNVVAWNVMISGHAQRGFEEESIAYFWSMRNCGVRSTRSTLGSVLSAIATVEALNEGQLVHSLAVKQGLDCNVYVGSSLINMYSKCKKVEAAKKVFDALSDRNVVLWNAILGGYVQNGYAYEVLELFFDMKQCGFQPDEFTYTSILSACASLESMKVGTQLHSFIIKINLDSNLFVGNVLMDMYAKHGALKEARQVFELSSQRDNVSWNSIIVGYVQAEDESEAFNLFQRMIASGTIPDEVSLASVLSACANIQALDQGMQIHCFSLKCGLEKGLYAGSSLVDMYTKCGATMTAHDILSCMPKRSVASINSLISGYAENNIESAIKLFRNLQNEGLEASEITFSSLLDSYSGPYRLSMGKQIHCHVLKIGLLYDVNFLGISLLCMYMNSASTRDADILFSEFPHPKNTVSWTAMISGYTRNNCSEEALLLYKEMRTYGCIPDQAAFASTLRACAILSSLRDGREVHGLIFRTSFHSDELISSALVDMYSKCGDMRSSLQVFDEMASKRDVISWNSMIVGLAKNGYAENALKVFDRMNQSHVKPDEVTFLGVLTACSHAGMVSEGRKVYDIMVNHYKIEPRVDHCACMVDILGRWGDLDEAEEFIDTLKFEPDAAIWASFLGACRIHGDDFRGKRAALKLIELEPQNSSPYVLLSNIHAASGDWDGVKSLRREMAEKGVKKFPGCSWISGQQKTNLFVAGDKFNPNTHEIHVVLDHLTAVMKKDTHVAEIDVYGDG